MSDLIDREDAIKALQELNGLKLTRIFNDSPVQWIDRMFLEAEDILRTLPSAEPERKKGEWVIDEHTYSGPNTYNYVCSACGAIGGSWLRDLPKNLTYPFCPFCGADMRGE